MNLSSIMHTVKAYMKAETVTGQSVLPGQNPLGYSPFFVAARWSGSVRVRSTV